VELVDTEFVAKKEVGVAEEALNSDLLLRRKLELQRKL
jgi:hypothetical protein